MSLYASVDVGSNSVRMAVADVVPGRSYRLVAANREITRIGDSVYAYGRVSERAMQDTCAVLSRFADVYRQWQPAAVRAVATSALRDTRNQGEFLARASEALGSPLEIISGREEARLIHLGVRARWPRKERELLLIDIGGGSAELTWSEAGEIRFSTSLPLGAVRLTQNFIEHDPPQPEEVAELEEFISQQFAGPLRRLGKRAAARAIGTSATAAAVVSAVNRIKRSDRAEAEGRRAPSADVRRLYRRLLGLNRQDRQRIPGIGPRRAEIIIPGTAVAVYFIENFTGGSLYYSAGGLRDGVIADLALRRVTADSALLSKEQRQTVTEMARRYGVPLAHARQVANLARRLFVGLATLHRLPLHFARWLEAAAYLHDIGHYISSTRHHRHSYYLVANSDMPGFDKREQLIVANICRYHRKALPADEHENFRLLSPEDRRAVALLVPILRVADGLDRGHRQLAADVECVVSDGEVRLGVEGKPGMELDLWAARRSEPAFRQVYQSKLTVNRMAQQ